MKADLAIFYRKEDLGGHAGAPSLQNRAINNARKAKKLFDRQGNIHGRVVHEKKQLHGNVSHDSATPPTCVLLYFACNNDFCLASESPMRE